MVGSPPGRRGVAITGLARPVRAGRDAEDVVATPATSTTFLTRPVSLALLIIAVVVLAIAVLPSIRRRREAIFQEEPT